MKKLLIFLIFIISVLFLATYDNTAYADENSTSLNDNPPYDTEFDVIDSYYNKHQNWMKQKIKDGSDQHALTVQDITGGELLDEVDSMHYDGQSINLNPLDEVTFTVTVADSGLYQLYFDYYVLPKTRLMPRLGLEINGEAQYTEMNDLEVRVDWQLENETKYDRYGDELTPKSEVYPGWNYGQGLVDPNFFFVEPLKFYLEEGENELSITLKEGYMLLGDIHIENRKVDIPTYDDYINGISKEWTSLKTKVTIEAEDLNFKSRQSIRSKYLRDPKVTPYEYKNRVLNVLDGYSYGEAGDSVTYVFEVEETGFYNLALKYYQNTNNGLPSHRRILIDGEVPFKEFEHYDFVYKTKWKNEFLDDKDGNPYNLYLEAGTHTLTLAVDNVKIRDTYHDLLVILDDIEEIATNINKMTGGLVDKERNWKITTYMPNLETDLKDISDRLGIIIEDLGVYTGNDKVPTISELKIAKDLIDEFVKDPEELPAYMVKFSEGYTSAHGRINTILPTLLFNPLHLDKIYFTNDAELPRANANFFVKLYEGLKAFVYSFFDPKYNETAKIDEDTIEIWVNKSRLYVEIMQRMIDEEFTPETGIKVQLSIMPDENKIILSNAAGTTPDGVVGISHGRPFELALRGVIEDLSQYEGFYDLSEEFNPSTYVPYIYDDGVYAIPETQDVKLLFYRKDILGDLGVEPPQTWEEVISLVPVLQKYDMNFYAPIGQENAYKAFDVTTPFIYQHGGLLYDPNTMETTINTGGAYEAYIMMTDLYTVYNLPITTSMFYQSFRNGVIPVGIGDANMYIQLKYAAPELAGQWDVMPIPGIENDEGVIERWDPTYGSSSIIFKDSTKKDQTWELIKWWSGSKAQSDFSYEIQSTLGDKFLYMTANVDGFRESAWPSDSKDDVLAQWEWIQTTGKVPGDYMLERELSNAWNKVVFDGVNQRVAIDEALPIINRELKRKLLEFGYMDEDGNIIKPYKIPTIENVESWVRKDETDN